MPRQTKVDGAKSGLVLFSDNNSFGSSMIGSLLFTSLSTHTLASIRHHTIPWNLLPFRESVSSYIGLQGKWLSKEP